MRRKKRVGSDSAAPKAKPKKNVDMSTVKLRAASKLLNQRKMLASLFKDVLDKLQARLTLHVDRLNQLY